jgi:hypothetical protein
MSSSTPSGSEGCGFSSFSGADWPSGGTLPWGCLPGPDEELGFEVESDPVGEPGGSDGASRASAECIPDGRTTWDGARLLNGPDRMSTRPANAGEPNPRSSNAGPAGPANSATPKLRPKPSRRRRNPSRGGGKAAAFGVGRILQRIFRSNFTAGLERPCGRPSPPGSWGAGGWPHCPAGVTLTHAAPAAESCLRAFRQGEEAGLQLGA